MNILIIDSSDRKEIKVGLILSNKKYYLAQKTNSKKTQVILPLIEKLLLSHALDIKNIQKIEVNTGPGSFTGLRVGVSVANTLARILKIPINDEEAGVLVEPIYK